MKKIVIYAGVSIFACGLFLALAPSASAANNCVSTGSGGNFSVAADWTSCGSTTPQASDTITIASGAPITLVAATTVSGVTINSGGILHGGTFLLTDSGNYVNNGTHDGSGGATANGASATVSGSGLFSNTGTFTISGATAPNFSTTSSISFGGGLTMSGPVTINTGGVVNVSGTTAISGGVTITNNGTVTLNGASGLTGTLATSTWKQGANATLNFAGQSTSLLLTGTLIATSTGNTVNYASGTQTMKAVQYYNLGITGKPGTRTTTGVTIVNGNFSAATGTATVVFTSVLGSFTVSGAAITTGAALTVSATTTLTSGTLTQGSFSFSELAGMTVSGGTFSTGAAAMIVNGTIEVSGGTFTNSQSTGAKTFFGNILVDGGTFNGTGTSLFLGGGITQTSGSVAYTGTMTLATTTQSLNGVLAITTLTIQTSTTVTSNATATIAGVTTVNGSLEIATGTTYISTGVFNVNSAGSVLNIGSTTAASSLIGAGSWVQGFNSYLTLKGSGTSTFFVTTADFNTSSNTVNYAGGTQTLKVTTYQNLTFSVAGTKTTTGVTTVNGDFNAILGTATTNFTTIGGNMFISGGTITTGATSTVSGNFKISSGAFTTGNGLLDFVGTTEIAGGTFTNSNSTGNKIFEGDILVDGGTFTGTGSTAILNGGLTQTAGSVNYSGTMTLATSSQQLDGTLIIGTITVAPGITVINSASTTITSSNAFTLNGNWTEDVASALEFNGNPTFAGSGTFDATTNSNTVIYDRGGAQTCKVTAYNNLTFGGSGAKTCALTANVTGNVILQGTASWTLTTAFSILGNVTLTGGSLTTGGVAFTVDGTTEVSAGTLSATNNTGAKTFADDVLVDGGTLSGASTNVIFQGGLTQNAGTVNLSGTATFNTSNQQIDGVMTLGSVTVGTGITLTNSATTTISGTALTLTGSWLQDVNSSLEFNANITFSGSGAFDAATNPNTVIYDRTGTETCLATQYDNLTFGGTGNKTCTPASSILGNLTYGSGGGTWTLAAALTVNGNFTITTGTVDVNTGNFPVNLNGNLTNNGGIFNTRSDTVTLEGTNQEIVSGTFSGASDFFNLVITNHSGASPTDCSLDGFTPSVVFMNGIAVSGTYTVTTGGVRVEYDDGSTFTFANTDWAGPSGQLIYFRDSLATGGTWAVDISGTQQPLAYINVSQSDASGGNAVNAASVTNRDCGGNVNWSFGVAFNSPTAYTEAAYELYQNQNSLEVGPMLASANTPATLAVSGEPFRLRMLIAADATDSDPGVDSFLLQFAVKGNGADCSVPQFSYQTITTSSDIAFNTNAGAADGSGLVSTSTDPVDSGRTTVEQTYNSSPLFSVTSTISAGEDGNWDFSLKDNGAPGGTDYCFQTIFASGSQLFAYTVYPEVTTAASPFPIVSNVIFNNGNSDITLLPGITTTISVFASVSDAGGPGNIIAATGTIYRQSLGSNCSTNSLNCYQIAKPQCVFTGSTSTVTCSAGLFYFAQSTGDPSSSFPGDTWISAITVTNGSGFSTTVTSTPSDVDVLTAISVATSSINYGIQNASTTSGATNQITGVLNVGNSSTTLQLSGTAFRNGASTFATSSQHYATSSFTFGGNEQPLAATPTVVSGFALTTPTSTGAVTKNIFWGLGVPNAVATGTYSASTTFTAVFSQ